MADPAIKRALSHVFDVLMSISSPVFTAKGRYVLTYSLAAPRVTCAAHTSDNLDPCRPSEFYSEQHTLLG